MSEADDHSQRFLPRIRQELEKLPLTAAEIDQISPQIIATDLLLRKGWVTDPDSRLFHYADKVNELVAHFATDGLTTRDYLQVALKHPRLFSQSPATITSNITGFVETFAADGLTTRDYLQAALVRPTLFSQTPATISGNITGVVDHFAEAGLTTRDYLQIALKRPSLFYQSPATITGNITGVAEHFAADGLTTRAYLQVARRYPSIFTSSPATAIGNITGVVEPFAAQGLTQRDYLKAALKQPQLFSLSPATVAGNITGVVDHFAADGLTTRAYLRAALKQPPLFTQSPATIIGHVHLLLDLHRQGLVHFKGEAAAHPQPLAPLFAFLVRNPAYFCLAAENYTLREVSAHVRGERPTGSELLLRPLYRVEEELSHALGNADPSKPVPKERPPQEGGDVRRHARNVLLRALIREGFVKGTLER